MRYQDLTDEEREAIDEVSDASEEARADLDGLLDAVVEHIINGGDITIEIAAHLLVALRAVASAEAEHRRLLADAAVAHGEEREADR